MTERADIRARQLEHLRALLRAVRPANAFYENKLAAADIDDTIGSLEDFSARCPFTSKDELATDQSVHPPYGTNLTHPLEQYTRIHQTSGTTGQPLRWLDTPESWQSMLESWKEVYRAAGIKYQNFEKGTRIHAEVRLHGNLRSRLTLTALGRENSRPAAVKHPACGHATHGL